jgi:hypothetical protein
MKLSRNLLTRIYKWANRAEENFLTEAFAHLLDHLCEHAPRGAARILQQFGIEISPAHVGSLRITTQATGAYGRPDMEIRAEGRLLTFIESKVQDKVRPGQLAAYRQQLKESGLPQTRLILITRYPITLPPREPPPDKAVRWYQVAEELEADSRHKLIDHPVCKFLVAQFCGFLREKNMTMDHVGPELIDGAHAMTSLLAMVREAMVPCKLKVTPARSERHIGYNLQKKQFFFGLYWKEPQILVFFARYGVSPDAAKRAGGGEVVKVKLKKPGEKKRRESYSWRRRADLTDKNIDFFNRSKGQQQSYIAEFFSSSLAKARAVS